jgi:hypothetical protein
MCLQRKNVAIRSWFLKQASERDSIVVGFALTQATTNVAAG